MSSLDPGSQATQDSDEPKIMNLAPYQVKWTKAARSIDYIWANIERKHIIDSRTNIISRGIKYTMVGDKNENGLIYGRFVKLSSSEIWQLVYSALEEKITELDAESPQEFFSHFLWDVQNNIIIAEQNRHCLPHLSNTATNIVTKILKLGDDNPVEFIKYPNEGLEEIILAKHGAVNSISFKVSRSELARLKALNFPIETVMENLSENTPITASLRIYIYGGIPAEPLFPRFKRMATKIWEDRKRDDRLILDTDYGVLDLLDENFLKYNEIYEDPKSQEVGVMLEPRFKALRKVYDTNKDILLGLKSKGQSKLPTDNSS